MNRRSSRVGTTTVTDGSSATTSGTDMSAATATDMDFNRTAVTGDEGPVTAGSDASRWLLTRGSQYSIASLIKTVAVVALVAWQLAQQGDQTHARHASSSVAGAHSERLGCGALLGYSRAFSPVRSGAVHGPGMR